MEKKKSEDLYVIHIKFTNIDTPVWKLINIPESFVSDIVKSEINSPFVTEVSVVKVPRWTSGEEAPNLFDYRNKGVKR